MAKTDLWIHMTAEINEKVWQQLPGMQDYFPHFRYFRYCTSTFPPIEYLQYALAKNDKNNRTFVLVDKAKKVSGPHNFGANVYHPFLVLLGICDRKGLDGGITARRTHPDLDSSLIRGFGIQDKSKEKLYS